MKVIFPDRIKDKTIYTFYYNNMWYPIIKEEQGFRYATLYITGRTILILHTFDNGIIPEPTHQLSPKQIPMLSKMGMLHLGMSINKAEIDSIISVRLAANSNHNLRKQS